MDVDKFKENMMCVSVKIALDFYAKKIHELNENVPREQIQQIIETEIEKRKTIIPPKLWECLNK
jgi:hypothetical protein